MFWTLFNKVAKHKQVFSFEYCKSYIKHLFGRAYVYGCFWHISLHLCSIQSSYGIMLLCYYDIFPIQQQIYLETTLDRLTGGYYCMVHPPQKKK